MELSLAKLVKAGAPGPGNRRIYCNHDGVFIGPDCALIRAEADCAGRKRYTLRPRSEIAHLLDAGYGFHFALDGLMRSLEMIAKALDDGDAALAQIGTLQLRLPDLSEGAVNRMAAADRLLKAGYNPAEPRDWHGRWTTVEGSAGADPPSPTDWSGDSAGWTQEKKLLSLEPNFRRKVEMVLTTLQNQGFRPRIVYGWRSLEEQKRLLEEGKTKLPFSFHNAQHPDGTPNAYAVDIIDARWGWGSRR